MLRRGDSVPLVLALLVLSSWGVPTTSSADIIDTFINGETEVSNKVLNWGSTTFSPISIPHDALVTEASLNITGLPTSRTEERNYTTNNDFYFSWREGLSAVDGDLMIGLDEHHWEQSPDVMRTKNHLENVLVDDGARLVRTEWSWERWPEGPGKRVAAAGAWDALDGQMIIFGGFSAGLGDFNSLWTYSPDRGYWVRLDDAPLEPRHGAGAVWDTWNNRMLVFGGAHDDTLFGDIWAFDPATGVWEQGVGGPSPRARTAVAWNDADGVMYVFGGAVQGGVYDELWAYDPSVGSWSLKNWGPMEREASSAVWNPISEELIIFGGYDGGALKDVWVYDPAKDLWTQKNDAPFSSYGHTAVWDPVTTSMLVHGGNGLVGLREDVYSYNPGLDKWVRVGDGPELAFHIAVVDETGEQMLVFGGRDSESGDVGLGETWAHFKGYKAVGEMRSTYNDPIYRDEVVDKVISVNITTPTGTDYLVQLMDNRDKVVLSGLRNGDVIDEDSIGGHEKYNLGITLTTTTPRNTPVLHSWGLGSSVEDHLNQDDLFASMVNVVRDDGVMRLDKGRNGTWAEITPGPPPRSEFVMAHDADTGGLILFGGTDGIDEGLNDTWTWSAYSGGWVRFTDGPDIGHSNSGIWDPVHRVMIVFGGWDSVTPLNQTWMFDPSNLTWWRCNDGAPSRWDHSAVWDPVHNVMIVHGGSDDGSSPMLDTWAYDPETGTWEEMAEGHVPRTGHSAVWDPVSNEMVVFGGAGQSGLLNDTWSYNYSTDTWRALSSGATPRSGHSAVWDDHNDDVLVFGGQDASGQRSDIWRFDPLTGQWSSHGEGALNATGHGAVWDIEGKRMHVVGGHDGQALDGFWTFELDFENGGFTSVPIDLLRRPASIEEVEWKGEGDTQGCVRMYLRTSADNVTWSAWENITRLDTTVRDPVGRFMQWRFELDTAGGGVGAFVERVVVRCSFFLDGGSVRFSHYNFYYYTYTMVRATWNQTIDADQSVNVSVNYRGVWVDVQNGTLFNLSDQLPFYDQCDFRVTLHGGGDGTPILHDISFEYFMESYPQDVRFLIGGSWLMVNTGRLTGTVEIDGPELVSALNDYLEERWSNGGGSGNVTVPILVSSETDGVIELSDLSITFVLPPKIEAFAPSGWRESPDTNISVRFSEPMDRWSVEAGFSVDPKVRGTFRWDRDDMGFEFVPLSPLEELTRYEVTIDPGVYSIGGNYLRVAHTWSFKTGERPNSAPVIHSQPPLTVILGEMYVYEPKVTDANLDLLSFRLDKGPYQMKIGEDDGRVRWTPALDQVGAHQVVLNVTDGRAFTTQSFFVEVMEPVFQNQWPEVTSEVPTTKVKVGEVFVYHVKAIDEDPYDALRFSIRKGPNGMEIDPVTGLLTWSPIYKDEGVHEVTVLVIDGRGGYDEHNFTITVTVEDKEQDQAIEIPFLMPLLTIIILLSILVLVSRRRRRARRMGREVPAPEEEEVDEGVLPKDEEE